MQRTSLELQHQHNVNVLESTHMEVQMNRTLYYFVLCMLLVGNAASLTLRPGRLAVSADGNKNDRDDIGATPMALAILAKAGSTAKSKLVHYEYNDHIWGSNYYQKLDMTNSANGAASVFGFSSTIFSASSTIRRLPTITLQRKSINLHTRIRFTYSRWDPWPQFVKPSSGLTIQDVNTSP